MPGHAFGRLSCQTLGLSRPTRRRVAESSTIPRSGSSGWPCLTFAAPAMPLGRLSTPSLTECTCRHRSLWRGHQCHSFWQPFDWEFVASPPGARHRGQSHNGASRQRAAPRSQAHVQPPSTSAAVGALRLLVVELPYAFLSFPRLMPFVQQLPQRPNPSIERTVNGGPLSPAPAALPAPLPASHVKR